MELYLETQVMSDNYFVRKHLRKWPECDLVVHAHELSKEISHISKHCDLVLLQRRDIFAQSTSMIIAGRAENWMTYHNPIQPQSISFDELASTALYINQHTAKQITACNSLTWQSTTEYYYEDILEAPSDFLKNRFILDGKPFNGNKKISIKSPYNYRELITNYHKLSKKFARWYKQNSLMFDLPQLKSSSS